MLILTQFCWFLRAVLENNRSFRVDVTPILEQGLIMSMNPERKWIFQLLVSVAMTALFFETSFANDEHKGVSIIESIVVTASKRERSLANYDGSIQVRFEEDLRAASVNDVADLEKLFPSLLIRNRGNRAYANLSVRGVTSPDFYNPSIQMYVDGIPQGAAVMTGQLLNVKSVELLRGPQGTLYGRNAYGGVININTQAPSGDPEFGVSGVLADKLKQLDVFVAGQLAGAFYADVVLRNRNEGGQVKDIGTREADVDDTEIRSGQGRLHYRPENGPLSAIVSLSKDSTETREELYIPESMIENREYDSTILGARSLLDRRVGTFGLNLTYKVNNFSVASITSSQYREMDRFIFGFNYPEQQKTLSQELRLGVLASDSIDLVAGVFYQNADFQRGSPGYPNFSGTSINQVDKKSTALFGELIYSMNSEVDFTLGVRWSKEDVSVDFDQLDPGAFAFEESESFTDVSPKLALGWQYMAQGRVYMSISQGFKPGGFNHSVSTPDDSLPYDSEVSTNLELGWRADLVGVSMQISAALYSIDSKEKQIYAGPLGAQVIRNIGDAKSQGVELDMSWQPFNSTNVVIGLAAGRSEFQNAIDTLTGEYYHGNRLPYAPDTAASFTLNQQLIATSIGNLNLYAHATYFDEVFFDESNSLQEDVYTIVDIALELNVSEKLYLKAFVDNLTDELYRTSSYAFGPGDIRSTLGETRVAGFVAELRF